MIVIIGICICVIIIIIIIKQIIISHIIQIIIIIVIFNAIWVGTVTASHCTISNRSQSNATSHLQGRWKDRQMFDSVVVDLKINETFERSDEVDGGEDVVTQVKRLQSSQTTKFLRQLRNESWRGFDSNATKGQRVCSTGPNPHCLSVVYSFSILASLSNQFCLQNAIWCGANRKYKEVTITCRK